MAVRSFDGIDDVIKVTDASLLRPSDAVTVAAYVRLHTGNGQNWSSIVHKKKVTGNASYAIQQNGATFTSLYFNFHVGSSHFDTASATGLSASTWYLLVARWASGETGSLRVYNADGTVNQTVTTAGTATGTLAYDTEPLHFAENESTANWPGYIAVAGLWDNKISDAEAESLVVGLQEWVDAAPSALWPFNQAAETTAVEDITGGGADESSRTGTTVVTDADPPDFDFTLGAPAIPKLYVVQSNLRLG